MTLQQLKYITYLAETCSINKASKLAFISQPSMSTALKDIETEIETKLFNRNNKGLVITKEGIEFLSYTKQIIQQYSLLEDKYLNNKNSKKNFSISTQHYSFAVKAFINMANFYDTVDYELSINETKTHEVIEDVKCLHSEIGILYINDFNKQILNRIFQESEIEFKSLCICDVYVYMWNKNPLANEPVIDLEQLEPYPCLSFDQGKENSFYFSEEVLSTHNHKRIIKVNDRGTMLNLMKGLGGYTFCSGIISEELNGDEYVAIPLSSKEKMEIGYIKKTSMELSELAMKYLEEFKKLI